MIEHGKVLDGLFHRLTLTGKVFLFVACIGLVAQQVLRVFGHLLQIPQVVHVGIKAGTSCEVGTDTDDHDDDDHGNQSFLLIDGVGVQFVDEGKRLLVHVLVAFTQQLGQEQQTEQGGA